MSAGSGDAQYRETFAGTIAPAVAAFKPEAIIISAGFDAHHLDPLAQMDLTAQSFVWMTREVLTWAERYAQGRVVSLLEGGYHLDALAECVEAHLQMLHVA